MTNKPTENAFTSTQKLVDLVKWQKKSTAGKAGGAARYKAMCGNALDMKLSKKTEEIKVHDDHASY